MKRIFGSTGSIFATTHSYMITIAETLLPHIYVFEATGMSKFSAKMTLNIPNIKAYPAKIANMSKQDHQVFLKVVL